MSEERTEDATPHKIRMARKEGQVPRSQELATSMGLLLGALLFSLCAPFIATQMVSFLHGNLSHMNPNDLDNVFVLASRSCVLVAALTAPIAVATMLGGVVTQALYSGVTPQLSHFKPNFGRLNPLEGVKRYFTRKQLVESLRMLVKSLLFVYLGYLFVRDEMMVWVPGGSRSRAAVPLYLDAYWGLIWRVVMAQLVLGLLDAFYQRWEYFRGLRMTKYEVKQEFKQQDGDPFIKARMRAMQRKMVKMRSIDGVKKANVVITNPTHLAVALQYDFSMSAPKVVAKGADNIAYAIRKLARRHNVPIVEDKPLARALYEVEVDEAIPSELYRAVAQILVTLAKAEEDYAE